MSFFGTLPTFDHRRNDWAVFKSQLENFFIANDIDDAKVEKKKAILITSLSQEAHKLLKSLIHPSDINSATYDQLVEALNNHFRPVSSNFVERSKFYSAHKEHQETVQQWAAKLRTLAANCDFGSHLPIALRDKFIISFPRGPVKDKLFMEDIKTLTFEQAVEIAINAVSANPQRSNEKQHLVNSKEKTTATYANRNTSQQRKNPQHGLQRQENSVQYQQPPHQQRHQFQGHYQLQQHHQTQQHHQFQGHRHQNQPSRNNVVCMERKDLTYVRTNKAAQCRLS